MKHKIVGILDIGLSSLFVIQQVAMLLFVYPKLSSMYADFNAQLPVTTKYYPIFSMLLIVLYSFFLFVGIRLLKFQTKKLYYTGIAILVFMFLGAGYLVAMSTFSAVRPLYDLTNSIEQ